MLKNPFYSISENNQASNPQTHVWLHGRLASVAGHKVKLVVGFGFWGAANFPCCAFFLQFPLLFNGKSVS